jgi:hypothetical protein
MSECLVDFNRSFDHHVGVLLLFLSIFETFTSSKFWRIETSIMFLKLTCLMFNQMLVFIDLKTMQMSYICLLP